MTDDERIQQLLDELADTHATPEIVRESHPELLTAVRDRWQQSHPTDFWANFALAMALDFRDDSPECMRYYQAAIAIRPTVAAAHYNPGWALVDAGHPEDAIAEIQVATRLQPEAAFFHAGAAHTLFRLHRFEEAIEESRRAIEIEPRNETYLMVMGRYLVAHDRRADAVTTYRQSLALNPRMPEADRELRALLLSLERRDEALSEWQRLLSLDPPEHDAWDGYAELCLFLGDEAEYRRARRELLKRLRLARGPSGRRANGSGVPLPAGNGRLVLQL